MARKYTKTPDIQVEEVPTVVQTTPEHEEEAATIRSISKAGAARAALADGVVIPKQASVYIKQKYGVDISPQQFSAEKCRIKQRSGGQEFARNLGFPQAKEKLLMGSSHQEFLEKTDLLEALEIMKPLIELLGVDKVKRMVDLLG